MPVEYRSVVDLPPGVWRWPHVHPQREWACKGSGVILIVPSFLDRIENLRTRVGFALPINSGYRSPSHNAAVSFTGDDGPHTTGRAVDIAVHGVRALEVLAAAMQLGFTGFGLKQDGPVQGRYIHLDDLESNTDGRVRPALWTY